MRCTSVSGAEHAEPSTTHLLAHLPSDVREALLAVEALRLQAPVPEHLRHLRVLLAVLAEDQLALVVVVVVLSTPAVLSTLYIRQTPRPLLAIFTDRPFPYSEVGETMSKSGRGSRTQDRTFGMLG